MFLKLVDQYLTSEIWCTHFDKFKFCYEIHKMIMIWNYPHSSFHVEHMGPTCILSAPGGSHVGPMNLLSGYAHDNQLSEIVNNHSPSH